METLTFNSLQVFKNGALVDVEQKEVAFGDMLNFIVLSFCVNNPPGIQASESQSYTMLACFSDVDDFVNMGIFEVYAPPGIILEMINDDQYSN